MEEFGVPIAIVKDITGTQAVEQLAVEIETRLEIVVIILRDRQQSDAILLQPIDCGENIVAGECDLLHSRPEEIVEEEKEKREAAIARREKIVEALKRLQEVDA